MNENAPVPVPATERLPYSWHPVDHYLVDDDGVVVGVIPKIKEVPLSEQKFTKVENIVFYTEAKRKEACADGSPKE